MLWTELLSVVDRITQRGVLSFWPQSDRPGFVHSYLAHLNKDVFNSHASALVAFHFLFFCERMPSAIHKYDDLPGRVQRLTVSNKLYAFMFVCGLLIGALSCHPGLLRPCRLPEPCQ